MHAYPSCVTKLQVVVVAAALAVVGCGSPASTGPASTAQTGAPSSATPFAIATASQLPLSSPTATPTPTATTVVVATDGLQSPLPSPQPIGWREFSDGGPSGRGDHTWTVDGNAATAYLFGGATADGASNELWAFDLATDTWTVVQASGAPPAPRFGHTATWVPDVGLVVWSGQGRGAEFFDDIWAYDPVVNAWLQLPSFGSVPDARYGSCAALGPDGELWISHGFTFSGRFADTRSYNFDDGSWTDRTPLGNAPVERCLHDCYWSADDRLVLYAGQTTGVAALRDIWAYEYDLGEWTRGPDPEAAARQLYGLATDSTGTFAFVYGGGSLDGGYLDDAWSIDSGALELGPVEAPQGPQARSGAALILHSIRDRLLLFGGTSADGPLSDTWELGLI